MAGPKTARRAGKQWWRNIFGRLLGWGRDNADLSVEADLALQQAQDNHNMAARAAAGVVAEIKMLKERGAGLEDRLVEVDSDIAALQADGQALVTRKGYASAEEAATDPEFADIQNDLNVLLEDKAVVERELADYQASITALEPQVDSAREAIRDSQAAVEQLTRDRSDVHRMERQSAAQAAVNRNAAQLNSALNLDAPSMGDIKDRAARKLHTEQGVAEFAADNPERKAAGARRRAAERRRQGEVTNMFDFGGASSDASADAEPASATS